MINKKKVEKAISHYERLIGEATGDLAIAYVGATGFIEGIKFAETELFLFMKDFAIWTQWNGWHKRLITGNDYWVHGEYEDRKPKLSTNTLFQIFLAEQDENIPN